MSDVTPGHGYLNGREVDVSPYTYDYLEELSRYRRPGKSVLPELEERTGRLPRRQILRTTDELTRRPELDELTRRALEPPLPGCQYEGGSLPHSEDLWTLEFGCEHEHTGEEQSCGNHIERLRGAHRAGQKLQCHQCGHVCLSMYRVKETGEEFRFNA